MNKVVHFEIAADDTGRAQKFYTDVFGWKIEKAPMPDGEYHMITTVETDEKRMPKETGAINGGLMKRQTRGESTIIVVNVPDLDTHLEKIQTAGGKVVMPKMTVGDMGLYARITDTEGNIMGLWQDLK